MKKVVRLRVKELRKAQIDMDIHTDAILAEMMGISGSQIWRVKRPLNDEQHTDPSNQFIAGIMDVFGGPFERFFYLDEAN